MGRFEAQPLVEAVCCGSLVVRGELDPVTPEIPGPLHDGAHQHPADAMPPLIGVHMHRLHLGTEAASVLEMAEHDELADPDDLTVDFRHQDAAGPLVDLGQRGPIGGEVLRILLPLDQRSMVEKLHYAGEVLVDGLTDDHVSVGIGIGTGIGIGIGIGTGTGTGIGRVHVDRAGISSTSRTAGTVVMRPHCGACGYAWPPFRPPIGRRGGRTIPANLLGPGA